MDERGVLAVARQPDEVLAGEREPAVVEAPRPARRLLTPDRLARVADAIDAVRKAADAVEALLDDEHDEPGMGASRRSKRASSLNEATGQLAKIADDLEELWS